MGRTGLYEFVVMKIVIEFQRLVCLVSCDVIIVFESWNGSC